MNGLFSRKSQLRLAIALSTTIMAGGVLAALAPAASGAVTARMSVGLRRPVISSPNIVVGASYGDYEYPIFVAYSQGFYSKLGLNVSFQNLNTSAQQGVAALVGGSSQFNTGSSIVGDVSMQNGAALEYLMAMSTGNENDVIISKATAAAAGITASTPPLQAVCQLAHQPNLTVGVPSFGGDGYTTLAFALKQCGLPTSVFTFIATGSGPALDTLLLSGKIQAFSVRPPFTFQVPPRQVVTVRLSGLPAYNTKVRPTDVPLVVTKAFASAHPDSVQAFVTGTLEGRQFMASNPKKAKRDVEPFMAQAGINGSTPLAGLWANAATFLKYSPVISSAAYASTVVLVDQLQPVQITVPFSQAVDNTFINKAIKTLKLPIKLG